MTKKEDLLRSLEDKTDEEKIRILNRRFKLNWDRPENNCKFWYAKVFTYCTPREFEEELNFFLFIVNVFGYLWGICFNQEDTVSLGCTCSCGKNQTVLYYTITHSDL